MKINDVRDLLILAALWGASFIFMRQAVPEFGPLALIFMRVLVATLFLLPLLLYKTGTSELRVIRQRWKSIGVMAIFNTALPFCLLAYALQYVTGGFGSMLNATAPLWGAIVAWVWLGDRLSASRVIGLLVGFVGILVLVWHKLHWQSGGEALAIPAALAATLCYGIAASYTKKFLTGVNSLTLAAGSQLASTLLILPAAFLNWPSVVPGHQAWISAVVLGIACTGTAYIIFFRLLQNVGPSKAIAVTYLIPVFGVLWGGLFLQETPTFNMVLGCLIILAGTALSTGFIRLGKRAA
ncbi:DMT family transporter [Leeia sp. TBRC 13508]|uniref:DMT family transporter n=1 Tax=Leeia speluncae TaxID=2884804 RepID=A0ABS8D4J4_9NEIS|nr:DMT family transporter [Leeia speluncae]MCB6183113.1 DMT family transporter [Leeia speluncae]